MIWTGWSVGSMSYIQGDKNKYKVIISNQTDWMIVLLTTKSSEKNNLIFVYDEHMYNWQLGFTILNFNVHVYSNDFSCVQHVARLNS